MERGCKPRGPTLNEARCSSEMEELKMQAQKDKERGKKEKS